MSRPHGTGKTQPEEAPRSHSLHTTSGGGGASAPKGPASRITERRASSSPILRRSASARATSGRSGSRGRIGPGTPGQRESDRGMSRRVTRDRVQEAFDIALRVIACVLLGSLAVAAWHDVSKAWDVWYYHLPFAGRIVGLVDSSSFTFGHANQARFDGFPLFGELLQGLLWRITGRPECASFVALAALPGLAWFLKRTFAVPAHLSILAFVAIPLVQIHATACYVDLPANACVTMLALLAYRQLVSREPPSVRVMLGASALAIAAANTKFQLVPVVLAAATVLDRNRASQGREATRAPARHRARVAARLRDAAEERGASRQPRVAGRAPPAREIAAARGGRLFVEPRVARERAASGAVGRVRPRARAPPRRRPRTVDDRPVDAAERARLPDGRLLRRLRGRQRRRAALRGVRETNARGEGRARVRRWRHGGREPAAAVPRAPLLPVLDAAARRAEPRRVVTRDGARSPGSSRSPRSPSSAGRPRARTSTRRATRSRRSWPPRSIAPRSTAWGRASACASIASRGRSSTPRGSTPSAATRCRRPKGPTNAPARARSSEPRSRSRPRALLTSRGRERAR